MKNASETQRNPTLIIETTISNSPHWLIKHPTIWLNRTNYHKINSNLSDYIEEIRSTNSPNPKKTCTLMALTSWRELSALQSLTT